MGDRSISETIASVASSRFPYTDGEVLEIAAFLFDTMEKLDPTVPRKPDWAGMSEGAREFYRFCTKEILLRANQVVACRPTATK